MMNYDIFYYWLKDTKTGETDKDPRVFDVYLGEPGEKVHDIEADGDTFEVIDYAVDICKFY